MGGPCDLEFEGETMEEVARRGGQHIMTTTDGAHKPMKEQMINGTEKGKEEWFGWFKGLWDKKADSNSQKGFVTPVIITIVTVMLVLGGIVYYVSQSQTQKDKMAEEKAMMEREAMEQKEKDAMMEKKDGEMMQDDLMMKKDEGVMMDKGETMMKYSGAVLAGKSAPLLDFTKTDYDAARKTDKLVVLYFYANWCPICKAEVSNALYPAFNELTTDKVVGFRVSYNDNETNADEKNLAKEFGVAYQHTKVFVKNDQRILKSPEGWDEKRYDIEINKVLGQ